MLDYPKSANSSTTIIGDFRADTDICLFIDGKHEPNIPNTLRTLHFYMPQEPNPIVRINVESIVIGRDKGEDRLDLSLQYAKILGVSRDHAEIFFQNDYYFITDLGSTNGTYINDHKLIPHKPYLLQQSDEIRFGHFLVILGFS